MDQAVQHPNLVNTHVVEVTGLLPATYQYRILSRENNPDGGASLTMRSPVRSFTVIPTTPGDFDGDGDVDMSDFGRFQACYTGQGIPQNHPNCTSALLDEDADVDDLITDEFDGAPPEAEAAAPEALEEGEDDDRDDD